MEKYRSKINIYLNNDPNCLCFRKNVIYNGIIDDTSDNRYRLNDELRGRIMYHICSLKWLEKNFVQLTKFKFGR